MIKFKIKSFVQCNITNPHHICQSVTSWKIYKLDLAYNVIISQLFLLLTFQNMCWYSLLSLNWYTSIPCPYLCWIVTLMIDQIFNCSLFYNQLIALLNLVPFLWPLLFIYYLCVPKLFYLNKRLAICCIEYQKYSKCIFVICASYHSIFLLTCCVPQF